MPHLEAQSFHGDEIVDGHTSASTDDCSPVHGLIFQGQEVHGEGVGCTT